VLEREKSVFGLIPLTSLIPAFALTALLLAPRSPWVMLLFAGLGASCSVTFSIKAVL